MENTRVGSPDDGYSLPPIVEWLSFTVDQLKATVNLFSTEVQGVLTEFVDKNLTDLLREDYKSAKISHRVVNELNENVNRVRHNLREQIEQAEGELLARFPLLQSGNQNRKNGLNFTEEKIKKSKDSGNEAEEISIVAGSSRGTTHKTSSNGSGLSNISDDDNDIVTELNGTIEVSEENLNSDVETISDTGSNDKSSNTNGKFKESKPEESMELEADPVSETESMSDAEPVSDGDLEPINSQEDPAKGNSIESHGSPSNEPPSNFLDLDLSFESPASPAETVFFDAGRNKTTSIGTDDISEENDSVKDKKNVRDLTLLPPPSPPETVFLGPPKNASSNLSCKRKNRDKISLAPPPSPPETVFLEKPNSQDKKNCDLENLAKKSILSHDSDDDTNMEGPASPTETVFLEKPNSQDKKNSDLENLAKESILSHDSDNDTNMEGPPSPTETVFLSKDSVEKINVNAPFKLPKKVAKVKVEEKDSSDDEKPGHSRATKKTRSWSKESVKIKDGGSDVTDTDYSYENDYKLNPGVCYVSLERLANVILDKLRANKTIDLSLYKDRSKSNRKRRSEPEDEIVKALRRLAAYNPLVRERDTKTSRRKSTRAQKTKKKKSDDECEGRDFDDDATTEDSSENEPVLQRTIPAQQGIPKEDLVGSEDEDLDGGLSSSSEEDSARKSILKEANKLKTEGSSDDEPKKTKKKKSGESYYTPGVCRVPNEKSSGESDSDDFFSKKNLRGNKKKTIILSDSDEKVSKKSEESDDDCLEVISSDSDFETTKKTRRKGRRYSTDSDSDYKKKKKTRKRVKDLSDSDASTKKKRRKRIKEEVDIASGSDSDVKEITDDNADKGRKNIRKVMNKKDLRKATRLAEEEEENRKKRIADRQAQFNEIFEAPRTEVVNSLVLDFDQNTKEALVSVDPIIVKKLKPHQVDGVRFMWNACFETVEQFKKPNNEGGGCILAHCMGLGKTLQTVTFIHTVMTSENIGLKTALVICPLNTVGNWFNELKMWLKDVDKRLNIHKLYDEKNNEARAHALEAWQRRGGVGIINYESFRSLVLGNRLRKSTKTKITAALVSPGPEIVVCDEGHVFKNAKSKMALAVNQIKTKRRIILTGTPLQNNLIEYHCMMEFVKPKLLGSKKEFSNRFVNPITNGQHKDSTARDVSIMKKRAHVLHKLLDGCVQRLDYTVLLPYLPPKYEYVVLINMTEIQKKMYTHYLDSIKQDATVKELISGGQLLKHAANLAKVWCHPYALEMKSANYNANSSESEGSLKEFIDDRSDVSDSRSDSDSDIDWLDSELKSVSKSKIKAAPLKIEDPVETGTDELSTQLIKEGGDWWSKFFKSKNEMQLTEHSSKLMILFEILKTCESIQDKVLVFSQYLYSLDIIESYLEELDELEKRNNTQDTFPPQVSRSRWRKNIEYFRIDGSTKSADRQKNCDIFNKTVTSRAKLFLISTKAGGLGINLFGANRVVIFDASWNPSQDMQSIFRVFRFGQTKPCYIYRLLAKGTMEEKIYNRQVVKLSLSGRVVDEHQIERHFTFEDIAGMYTFDPDEKSDRPLPPVPKDRLLADLLISQKDKIDTYLEHDSLLQNKVDEGLTEEERKIAWDEYQNENLENERRQQASAQVYADLQADMQASQKMRDKLRTLHPGMSEERLRVAVNIINGEISELRKLTNAFHAQNMALSDARRQQLTEEIAFRKRKIQSYFEEPSPQVNRAAPLTAVSNDNPLRLTNFNNILEQQPNFAQYFYQNDLNQRVYPSNTVRRPGIPTTTVPYSIPNMQPMGQLPHSLLSQSNPAVSQGNSILPTVNVNPPNF